MFQKSNCLIFLFVWDNFDHIGRSWFISNYLYVCTAVPNLWSCFAVPAEGENIVSLFEVCRNFHFVHQRPWEGRLSWFQHTLTCPMKSRGLGRKLPTLGARRVDPTHVCRVANGDGVHRPLRAKRECSLSRSVGNELNPRAGIPSKLHPAIFRCKA